MKAPSPPAPPPPPEHTHRGRAIDCPECAKTHPIMTVAEALASLKARA